MTPNFQAQMAHAADPDSVAFETALERDFPYHTPPQIVSVSMCSAMAGLALIEFHDVWMNFLEGRSNGCV
jgi:hypothetical protein